MQTRPVALGTVVHRTSSSLHIKSCSLLPHQQQLPAFHLSKHKQQQKPELLSTFSFQDQQPIQQINPLHNQPSCLPTRTTPPLSRPPLTVSLAPSSPPLAPSRATLPTRPRAMPSRTRPRPSTTPRRPPSSCPVPPSPPRAPPATTPTAALAATTRPLDPQRRPLATWLDLR